MAQLWESNNTGEKRKNKMKDGKIQGTVDDGPIFCTMSR